MFVHLHSMWCFLVTFSPLLQQLYAPTINWYFPLFSLAISVSPFLYENQYIVRYISFTSTMKKIRAALLRDSEQVPTKNSMQTTVPLYDTCNSLFYKSTLVTHCPLFFIYTVIFENQPQMKIFMLFSSSCLDYVQFFQN